MMVSTRRTRTGALALSCFLLLAMLPFCLQASGNWKEVAFTKQKDIWYVDQIIGFSSKGAVLAARARLKLVPGRKSVVGQNIRTELLSDGVNADSFQYFVQSVEVNCKKKVFAISRIDFYDDEDTKIFGQTFTEPKQYPLTPGSAFELIGWDLCQNKPGPIDTLKDTLNALKDKEFFLYFFPRRGTAK